MPDDQNADTTPTFLLDRYRIEGFLGEGGLGTVVKAFDTRLKRTVAIKTLKRTSYANDPELFRALEERFAREAEAGSRMGANPNLVTVYDLVTDADRTQYLILEFVPGGNLAERIKSGPLPRADALRLTADAARGLQAAHNVGIVHRDVKPANIFISEDGRAQVGDFGIAQIDDISGRTQTMTGHPGTPLYMSPEQAHSTGYVRPSSDQYSLGLVLFEMLIGMAYKRLETHEADAMLAAQPLPIRTLTSRMFATEPGDRYPNMSALITAIEAARSQSATVAYDDAATLPVLPPPGVPAIHETPRLNLSPVSPVLESPPTGTTVTGHSSSRALALALGGIAVVVAVIAGTLFFTRSGTKPIATTPPNTSVANLGTPSQPVGGTLTSTQSVATPTSGGGSTPTAAPATTPLAPPAIATQAAPTVPVGPPPITTSLLSYLDGRVTLPGEGESDGKIVGDPVQVIGVDLSHGAPRNLPAVSAPDRSRVVRTIWAPTGTRLATLVRQPISGGFSTTFDLAVIDIATGKTTMAARNLNTLPTWSPDSTTLVYGVATGMERQVSSDGRLGTAMGYAYDIHLVRFDGSGDHVIAHIAPSAPGGRGGTGCGDLVEQFVGRDQFHLASRDIVWAADDSLIALDLSDGRFTMKPNGDDLRRVSFVTFNTIAAVATDNPYVPANGVQIRLMDDTGAFQWRYENSLEPTANITPGFHDGYDRFCANPLKGTANAGYRNQIVARLPDGTERRLTDSSTFKYHITVSPDGTAVAFTALTFTDYDAAAKEGQLFTGYTVDVFVARLSGGPEIKISTSGSGHHPSWERDIPVKASVLSLQTKPPAVTTWMDPNGRISLQYPSTWTATRDNSEGNILALSGPDSVLFFVNVFPKDRPAKEGLQGFHQRHLTSTTRTYTDSLIEEARVGGAPAAVLSYDSVNKTGAPDPHRGMVWYVDSGDKQFVIEVYWNTGKAVDVSVIDAIIDSILFPR